MFYGLSHTETAVGPGAADAPPADGRLPRTGELRVLGQLRSSRTGRFGDGRPAKGGPEVVGTQSGVEGLAAVARAAPRCRRAGRRADDRLARERPSASVD